MRLFSIALGVNVPSDGGFGPDFGVDCEVLRDAGFADCFFGFAVAVARCCVDAGYLCYLERGLERRGFDVADVAPYDLGWHCDGMIY